MGKNQHVVPHGNWGVKAGNKKLTEAISLRRRLLTAKIDCKTRLRSSNPWQGWKNP